jgi:hypothetical protein
MNDKEINFDEELSYILPGKIEQEIIKINNKPQKKLRRIKMSDLNLTGIENLKKVGIALTNLVNAGVDAKDDDGKITWTDITHFIKIVPSIISAIPAIKHIKAEITDITADELKDFKVTILENVKIKNELDKELVQHIFDLLHTITKVVSNIQERKKEKNEPRTE